MLVHDFALVPLSADEMTERLRSNGPALLSSSVERALHGSFGTVPFQLEVGELLSGSQAHVLPFSLSTDRMRAVFHRLQGDLEYFALEPASCQLRLLASYGRNGSNGPSRVDHARVETMMRDVLTQLARQLEESAAMRPCHG